MSEQQPDEMSKGCDKLCDYRRIYMYAILQGLLPFGCEALLFLYKVTFCKFSVDICFYL